MKKTRKRQKTWSGPGSCKSRTPRASDRTNLVSLPQPWSQTAPHCRETGVKRAVQTPSSPRPPRLTEAMPPTVPTPTLKRDLSLIWNPLGGMGHSVGGGEKAAPDRWEHAGDPTHSWASSSSPTELPGPGSSGQGGCSLFQGKKACRNHRCPEPSSHSVVKGLTCHSGPGTLHALVPGLSTCS